MSAYFGDLFNDLNALASHYDVSNNLRAALLQAVIDDYNASKALIDRPVNKSEQYKGLISLDEMHKLDTEVINNSQVIWDQEAEE